MKKIIAIILAALMTATFALSAVAADAPGPTDIDVKAKYVEAITTGTKYSVDISWGKMEFTYTVSGTKEWNPATHSYDDDVTGQWTSQGNNVVVENHSNTGITANFAFSAGNKYSGVTYSFNHPSLTIPSAVGKSLNDTSLVATTNLTLGGTIEADVTTMTVIGTITVTIS